MSDEDTETRRVHDLACSIGDVCHGHEPIRIMRALGSIAADLISQFSKDVPQAHLGAEAFSKDVRETISRIYAARAPGVAN